MGRYLYVDDASVFYCAGRFTELIRPLRGKTVAEARPLVLAELGKRAGLKLEMPPSPKAGPGRRDGNWWFGVEELEEGKYQEFPPERMESVIYHTLLVLLNELSCFSEGTISIEGEDCWPNDTEAPEDEAPEDEAPEDEAPEDEAPLRWVTDCDESDRSSPEEMIRAACQGLLKCEDSVTFNEIYLWILAMYPLVSGPETKKTLQHFMNRMLDEGKLCQKESKIYWLP